jgi:elongation factor P
LSSISFVLAKVEKIIVPAYVSLYGMTSLLTRIHCFGSPGIHLLLPGENTDCSSFAGLRHFTVNDLHLQPVNIQNSFMANTADISRGLIIKLDGSLYKVVEFGENKTARAAAKVWAKLAGVDNNRSIEKTWNSGDTIYPVRVERKEYQFLYKDESGYNFMDNETFEQVAIAENVIDAPQFLRDGDTVSVLFNTETEQPMSVELPDKVVMRITYSEPGLRGDTATRTLKPATVETGATVMVPLFVNEGDLIRVNTKSGEYVERVKE